MDEGRGWKPLFGLGRLVATMAALELLERSATNAMALVRRHQGGDWGDLTPEDKVANAEAVCDCERIVSAYDVEGGRVWVITEADRSATTLLLPSDY